ncbi:hypothetical protein B0H11DRAFT_2200392 [Mycena galericulata]|nr:hypothetical protein B0H11DRAFT_2200392 [Mycena galericulata]
MSQPSAPAPAHSSLAGLISARTTAPQAQLSPADWSREHICAVFEAPSEPLAQRARTTAFSPTITAHLNGTALDFPALARLVDAIRASARAPRGLVVEWTRADATPDDPATNRDGSMVGAYIIRGIWKRVGETLCEFERHKEVQVRIESQADDPAVDSRIIVQLDIVATDVPVNRP